MTRKQQIEEQAKMELGDHCYPFIRGVEWADANPIDFIGDLITQRSIAFDYGRDQAAMLKVAIEALQEIGSTYGTTTQKGFENKVDLKIADEALKKIEKMKKELDNGK